MPSRQTTKTDTIMRDRVFWLAATVLVLGQLLAFWMLCSHQVRQAEARHASAQVERMAVVDCLRSVPNATLGSCTARVAPPDREAASFAAARNAAVQVVPVNYVYQ